MSSSWLCVDANLVLRLVADPDDTRVQELWQRWDAERRPLAAPTLLFYEVTNVLHRYRRLGVLGAATVRSALNAALALPLHLVGEAELHGRALDLAERFSLPAAYDAHYLAVAESLGGELWTADARLAHVVQSALPWVRLVG
jgi:predicted nucleic acid-binding protein